MGAAGMNQGADGGVQPRRGIGVTLLAKKDVLYLDRLRLPHRMLDWLVVCASAFKEAMWY
jgi:hypothetical protein